MFLTVKKAIKFLKYFFLFLVVSFLLLVGIINLPFVHRRITARINTILKDQGIPAHVGKVSLLINGNIGIDKLEFIAPGNDTLIYAESVDVSISILPLFRNRFVFESIGLTDVTVHLSADSSGTLNLLTYFPGNGKSTEDNSDTTAASWEINAEELHLVNCSFSYNDLSTGISVNQHLQKADLELNELSLLESRVDVDYLGLEGCKGSVTIGPSPPDLMPDDTAAIPWKISADEVELKNIDFSYRHTVTGQQADIKLSEFNFDIHSLDLMKEELIISQINMVSPVIFFNPGKADSLQGADTIPAEAFNWKLLCDELTIADGSFTFSAKPAHPLISWLPVSKLNASIKKIAINPSTVAMDMKSLSMTMGKQGSIQNGTAQLELDSSLKGNAIIALETILADSNSFRLVANISGYKDTLRINKCNFSTQSGIEFLATGYITDVTNFPTSACHMDFFAKTGNRTALKNLITLFAPQADVPVLQTITVKGTVRNTCYAPVFSLGLFGESGQAGLAGKYNMNTGAGDIKIALKQVRADKLLGSSFPSQLTGNISLQGTVKDINHISGNAEVIIDSVTYNNVTAHTINITSSVQDSKGNFNLSAADSIIRCELHGDYSWGENSWTCKITGPVSINESQTKLLPAYVAVKSNVDATFDSNNNNLNTWLRLNDILVSNNEKSTRTDNVSVNLNMGINKTTADISGDFITAKFNCSSSIEKFSEAIGNSGVDRILSLDSTQFLNAKTFSQLPAFSLDATVKYDSLISFFYPDTVLNFHNVEIKLYKSIEANLVRGNITMDDFRYLDYTAYGPAMNLEVDTRQMKSTLTIDSLNLNGVSRGLTELNLEILPATVRSSVLLNDSQGRPLYRLSAEALKQPNQVVFRSTSPDWIINAGKWNFLNPQFLVWQASGDDYIASLNLQHEQMQINLTGKKSEQLLLELKNFMVSGLITPEIMEGMPDGLVNAKITYSEDDKNHLGIDMDVKNFTWNTIALEHLTAKGQLTADTSGFQNGNVMVRLNDSSMVNVSVDPGMNRSIQVNFRNLPVALLEPVTEEYVNGWQGYASGEMNIATAAEMPVINGEIRIKKTSLTVVELKSRFFIPQDKIVVKNSVMYFDNFIVLDSTMKKLKTDGTINLQNTENITADLKVSTDNLNIMNTTVADNPEFFGSLVVNSSLSIKGQISNLEIRGNVALENGTNITYRHIEDLSVKETQKVVTFTKFNADSLYVPVEPGRRNSVNSLPLITTKIEIDPKSRFNFEISSGYDINVSITGSGLLDYSMLPNNTINLTGTYEIKEGTTQLKFSGWPLKYFDITPGSSVRWDGDIYNPQINLEATSKVKGSYINPVDNKSRSVDFIVFMRLANQLSQLEVVFDVRSQDQYISSVLNTLSEDERMRQAINLLLFESINLPNIESNSNYMASQINSFWESQLNALSKTNLKYVDLSFGLDTYSQSTASGGQEEKTSLTYTMERKFMNDRASIKVSGRFNDEDPSSGSSGNSMLENFIFEYALDSINRRFLKLYTKKDYEDILDGEVTKSGAGFIYRKTYPTFRDMWVRRRNQSTKE